MVQDNRKWRFCGYCGHEHLEGPCPQYGDPRIPSKAENNRSLKASLAAERSELDRLRKENAALLKIKECAQRLADHAESGLGGCLSAGSPARDIPSNAVSMVKARHLASLRATLQGAKE